MGNNSTKESRAAVRRSGNEGRQEQQAEPTTRPASTPADRLANHLYGVQSRPGRSSSRPELSFFGINTDRDANQQDQRRETKQEREARRLEKERLAREKEREKSLLEEHVDGGYLVTLGTYTGPEDFSKAIVRQLQIERRLAPFWKGLNDHDDSWTEHQIVAAARGLPIPPPDEVPPELRRPTADGDESPSRLPTETDVTNTTLPITSRSISNMSDNSMNLSPSHPAFSTSMPTSPTALSSSMSLFRGRAKTLASLTSASRSESSSAPPKEIKLADGPYINGQPLEAYLYKDAAECPICFLYYPPYLNKTRCCDQPICSECFVQIKRPDPHPPEHHDEPGVPSQPRTEEDEQLVSEPSACPFCKAPEFGVTYEPPGFRRGLVYAGDRCAHPLAAAASAMSSQTSLGSMASRRRTTSLSVTDKSVITTDKVRPDWAKKLADARALALRRSAAATALHNAAYVLGNTQELDLRAFALGRRRRLLERGSASENAESSGMGATQSDAEPSASAGASRRTRIDDLEELMLMEAIRLSLAADEEKRKKDEKEAAKDLKKKAKQDAKDAKKADKAARKASRSGSLYPASANQSTSTWATTSMTRSTSNLGFGSGTATPGAQGKGKAPALASTAEGADAEDATASSISLNNAQKHLEDSRANIGQSSQLTGSLPVPIEGSSRNHRRQFSGASSITSSFLDSTAGSYRNDTYPGESPSASALDLPAQAESRSETPNAASGSSLEPMLNFRSLAAMIDKEEKEAYEAEHHEDIETPSVSKMQGMTGILDDSHQGHAAPADVTGQGATATDFRGDEKDKQIADVKARELAGP